MTMMTKITAASVNAANDAYAPLDKVKTIPGHRITHEQFEMALCVISCTSGQARERLQQQYSGALATARERGLIGTPSQRREGGRYARAC